MMMIDPQLLANAVDAFVELVRPWPQLKRLALVYFLRTLAAKIDAL